MELQRKQWNASLTRHLFRHSRWNLEFHRSPRDKNLRSLRLKIYVLPFYVGEIYGRDLIFQLSRSYISRISRLHFSSSLIFRRYPARASFYISRVGFYSSNVVSRRMRRVRKRWTWANTAREIFGILSVAKFSLYPIDMHRKNQMYKTVLFFQNYASTRNSRGIIDQLVQVITKELNI